MRGVVEAAGVYRVFKVLTDPPAEHETAADGTKVSDGVGSRGRPGDELTRVAAANPRNGTYPEPEALRQSAQ